MKSVYFVILTSLLLSACTNSRKLNHEHDEWKAKLATLPIGATHEQVKQWAQLNDIPIEWHKHHRYYWARKDVTSFWCSQFVSVKIQFNQQDIVSEKDSHQYGKCGF